MALPAGRYGVTKRQLNKVKNLPVNTIGMIEEAIETSEEYADDAVSHTVGWISDDQVHLYDWSGTVASVLFTYTKNQLTLNGTCTDDTSSPSSAQVPEEGKYTLKAGSYEIISDANNVGWEVIALDPVQYITSESKPFTITEDKTVFMRARITNGTTFNNQVVHVELRRQSVDAVKADNSVIAPVEDQATCQNPDGYAVGEHFIRNRKFCTAITSIANGATFTLNTNYVEGTIADNLIKQATFSGTVTASSNLLIANDYKSVLGIKIDNSAVLVFPYKTSANGLGFHFASQTFENLASGTEVSGTYYYI